MLKTGKKTEGLVITCWTGVIRNLPAIFGKKRTKKLKMINPNSTFSMVVYKNYEIENQSVLYDI